MDIFEERYFNFNRKIFNFMGLWPYGSKTRNIRKYILLFTLLLFVIPCVICVKVNFSDVDRVMLNLVAFFITFLIFLKMLAMIVAEDKMKVLYQFIANNWLAITDEKEIEILQEYSERGRQKAINYFALVQIGASSLFVLPLIPKILDIIYPIAKPRPTIYILEGELLIDRETYYWLYYLWDAVLVIVNSNVNVSVDTMFIICVEHCCALYAIIKYRLRNFKLKIIDNCTGAEMDCYSYAVGIIRLHQNTLIFTKTVNKAFSILFFFILIANIATIPLCAVTVLSNLNNPLNFMRFGMLLSLIGVHLFMLFWPGQNVLDHGTELINDAYCNEWYDTPFRTKKMIIILMIRCSQPIVLSAGGLMLMNFETFAMIARTAVSYITVVASFR